MRQEGVHFLMGTPINQSKDGVGYGVTYYYFFPTTEEFPPNLRACMEKTPYQQMVNLGLKKCNFLFYDPFLVIISPWSDQHLIWALQKNIK